MPTIQPNDAGKSRGQKKEVRVDQVLMKPGRYEVTNDSTFTVSFPLMRKENGWWTIVDEQDSEVIEKVVMRMWTYDEMIEMRKMATKYDQMRRVHMIDHDVLNQLKIQKLLVSWTFDRDNPRLKIHHVNGVLTDESWKAITKLQPNLISHLMERMNRYYEFGG